MCRCTVEVDLGNSRKNYSGSWSLKVVSVLSDKERAHFIIITSSWSRSAFYGRMTVLSVTLNRGPITLLAVMDVIKSHSILI